MASFMPMTRKTKHAIMPASPFGLRDWLFSQILPKGGLTMNYCPYCGAELLNKELPFCCECGKGLRVDTQVKKPTGQEHNRLKTGSMSSDSSCRQPILLRNKKRSKASTTRTEDNVKKTDEGYDGYYDDILPVDLGIQKEEGNGELLKKIAVVIIGVLLIIALCLTMLYLT